MSTTQGGGVESPSDTVLFCYCMEHTTTEPGVVLKRGRERERELAENKTLVKESRPLKRAHPTAAAIIAAVTFPLDMVLANEENMAMFIRCSIMALVAAYLNFLSQMIANPPFCQHVSKVGAAPLYRRVSKPGVTPYSYYFCEGGAMPVLEMRNLEAPYLLPEHVFREKCPLPTTLEKDNRGWYFQTSEIAESLAGPGYNVDRLSVPYIPQVTGKCLCPPPGPKCSQKQRAHTITHG
ncbi:hypothetical protein JZ751_000722 [Albula glossodonta]|uniref:Uncharacterized protein n=1 Tax=Albula glossodonta TaxID=121402 RepID=A0A8T2PX83_9TELE|nr:hypothetical protein JZ751_000722 [Albula glossodonta]